MWERAMVAHFEALSRHFLGGTEENHENLSQDSRYPSQNLSRRPHEHNIAVFRMVSVSPYIFSLC
jgi:hypothetical protein